MSDIARDVTDETFAEDVLERSKTGPVVVDLWAPWCGPCKALGPVLERVAESADGDFELVKARLTLAELLGDAGGVDEALDVLAKAAPSPAVDQLRSALRLAVSADVDLEDLQGRADTGDLDAAIHLGRALNAQGNAESALEVLLAALQRDLEAGDSAARQAVLDVFNVLGSADPRLNAAQCQVRGQQEALRARRCWAAPPLRLRGRLGSFTGPRHERFRGRQFACRRRAVDPGRADGCQPSAQKPQTPGRLASPQ